MDVDGGEGGQNKDELNCDQPGAVICAGLNASGTREYAG